ncbi:MAG: nitroreductase family protein [Desulfobacterales bacterium]
MIRDLVLKNRSYRRWREAEAIDHETLVEFVDLARLCGSACNQQALKFIISDDPERNALIYPYVAIDNNPVEGERAAAYIVILEDRNVKMVMQADLGIAAQTIMLAATEKGYGGVMIGAINRPGLQKALKLPDHLAVVLILAIGKTVEEMVIETQEEGTMAVQWWETKDIRHVPKRALDEILVDYPKQED